MIDHLTAYLPTERLVGAITKMYDFLHRFLAKALKFYTRSRISKYLLLSICVHYLSRVQGSVSIDSQAMEAARVPGSLRRNKHILK